MKKSKSQRIVVFAPHYAEYATRLAIALAQRARVLLILDRANRRLECDDRLMADALDGGGIHVVEFDSVGRRNRLRALAIILGRMLAFRPGFILFQEEEGALTAWVARLAGRFFPILLTVHDPSPHTGADAEYLRRNVGHQRTTRAAARAFHVHGAFCAQQLVARLGRARPILDTAHGVILVPRADEIRPPEPGRMLMFGRMEAYKGLDALLDAIEIVAGRNIPFQLVLAGRGPELARLADRIAMVRQIEVEDDFLSAEAAIAQFQRASFVVLPYRDATQSGVAAAAFGNGRPVLATRVGGLVDALRPGFDGLLVAPGDPQALAAALETLLTDAALTARLSEGASRTGASTFAWSQVADRVIAFAADHDLGQSGRRRRRKPDA